MIFFFFQAEDGIRDRSPSRGLGDVYKRQLYDLALAMNHTEEGDDEAYAKAWFDFIADWNDELPEIPLYSNDYHDFFTSKLHDFEEDGYNWDATNAILYANME